MLFILLISCSQGVAQWKQTATVPSPRSGYALAYDSRRDLVILFGGSTGSGETWEWNGSRWALVSRSGPLPREDHRMAYDHTRGVVVLFGGTRFEGGGNSSAVLGDLWEWDGKSWIEVEFEEGPVARRYFGMAYDHKRKAVVLFGGSGWHYRMQYNDTWTWDGKNWARQEITGPLSRINFAMSYNRRQEKVILLGGTTGWAFFNDTWEWDGAEWLRRKAKSKPGDLVYPAMTFDRSRGKTVLIGTYGLTEEPVVTWEWDGRWWRKSQAAGPHNTYDADIAYDAARSNSVMLGHDSTGRYGTWLYDGSAWKLRQQDWPTDRVRPAMAYDSMRGRLILFGGDTGLSYKGMLWEWDGSEWQFHLPKKSPAARSGCAMVYDANRDQTILFGGADPRPDSTWRIFKDTWAWDGSSLKWHRLTNKGPSKRSNAALAYDSDRGVIVLFGGQRALSSSEQMYMCDTWEWDGSKWTLNSEAGPSPRSRHAMAYDSSRKKVVLYGGYGATNEGEGIYHGDTWEWDGESWSRVEIEGPGARAGHTLVFDPNESISLLYGGEDNGVGSKSDVWQFDGSAWIRIKGKTPGPRRDHAAAYDSRAGKVMVFGGKEMADLWQFSPRRR